MYTTKKVKASKTPKLDILASEAGRAYSKVVSLMRKVKRKKGFWLSQGAVQKYMRLKGYNLHSQTLQAIIQSYFDSLKSYFRVSKSNPDAKPPKRTPHFYKVRWIQNGITFKDGVVRLSNGKGNAAITLKSDVRPAYVEMYFQRGSYYFSLVYEVQIPPKRKTGKAVAIDMGEIHPIVSHDGEHTIIYNGRALRAIKQYLNKFKGYIQSKMDRCKHRSNRWYRLKRIKTKILAKLNAQIKDAEHKITSRFISDCIKAKADTIVMGDIKGIRKRAKFSKKSNQKVHQWAFARLQSMICYKAELAGLKVKFVSEAYTSQTCPRCGSRKKPTNRNYHCNHCGFAYHRDGVGAINLYNKVSGFILSPVVGVMASPIGVRFHPHLCKHGSHSV
jgi:putative transposase